MLKETAGVIQICMLKEMLVLSKILVWKIKRRSKA
jgi:hypothetical protein